MNAMQAAFSSLRVRDYRLFFIAQLVSQAGNNMQLVAQGWVVLQLTHSGVALGYIVALQYLPLLLFGPFGGALADRFDRRRILYVTQTSLGLIAVVLSILTVGSAEQIWELYLLAFLAGLTSVADIPARQSLIYDLVPRADLNNAIMLNSIEVNIARIVGPAVGGLILALASASICFALNAASFAVVVVSMAVMNITASTMNRKVTLGSGVLDGLKYAARTPAILLPVVMVAVVGMFAWEYPVTLPLLAQRTFAGGAAAYGVMMMMVGVGAVAGGFWTAVRSKDEYPNLPRACLIWGVGLFMVAVAPTYVLSLIALTLVGYGGVSFNALSKTTLQVNAIPAMRGWVMALWGVAWQGSTPFGGPFVGWIGQHAGPRWAIAFGGFTAVGAGLASLSRWRALRAAGARAPGTEPGGSWSLTGHDEADEEEG
jgi:MFS family permease